MILRLILLAVGSWTAESLHADDWPQWRGPQRDGVWRESGIVDAIPADGLTIRWRTKIGPGYSGVVVARGRVFVTDCELKAGGSERVLCLDEDTGQKQWSYSYDCDYSGMFYGAGPYATPLVHQNKVYVCSPKGHLHCFDCGTGKVIWSKNRGKDPNAVLPQCGCSSSPLVEGDLLIVMGGGTSTGCISAYHVDTGQEIWSALPERPSLSSPIVIEIGGQRQLIVWTLDSVASLDPRTGHVFWRIPSKAINEGGAVTTPAVFKDRLLMICEKAMLIRLAAEKPAASLAWQTRFRANSNTFVSPVFRDDRHYYAARRDELCCFEAATGKELWNAAGVSAGNGFAMFQMTPHDDQVFILNDEGKLILARLQPDGYHEVGRTFLIEPTKGTWTPLGDPPRVWAQPAYANGHIIARSDREIVRASLLAGERRDAPRPNLVQLGRRIDFAAFESPSCLAFFPDGKTLATGETDGTVALREPASGKAVQKLQEQASGMRAIAISPDGVLLASVGGNAANKSASIGLWNLKENKSQVVAGNHGDEVLTVAFSPVGNVLATAGRDMTVKLWNPINGQPLATLHGHTDAVTSITFSPDGKTLASASSDHTVRLWDIDERQARATLAKHEDEAIAVAFSRDGSLLATGGRDGMIYLYDPITGQERGALSGCRGTVWTLAFDSTDKFLVAGSADETVRFWDVATGRLLATLRDFDQGCKFAALQPNSRLLVTSGRQGSRQQVMGWDVVTEK